MSNNLEQKKKLNPYKIQSCINASVKDVDTEKRIVTGFYNSYNFFDSDQDVLIMGSAKRSIDNRGPKSKAIGKVKHALFHDLTKLPGKLQVLEETEKDGVSGIYFETKMVNTPLGNDTLINYQEGIYDNHSIGFSYSKLEYLEEGDEEFEKVLAFLINPEEAKEYGYLWLVKEINLFEGSTVSFGANRLTPYLGVKSQDPELISLKFCEKITTIEGQLKNGKQSDEGFKLLELQLKQLQQMAIEMFGSNSTLKKDPETTQKSRQQKKSKIPLI